MRPVAVIPTRRAGKGENLRGRSRESVAPTYPTEPSGEPRPMSDHIDQAALESLRAPAGSDLVHGVTAGRGGQPQLRAVEAADPEAAARIAELESQLPEERAGRKKAEA